MAAMTTIPDFDQQWDLPQTPLKTAYIVCSTPRSGSNLLCFSLAKQGIGVPIEYLNLNKNKSAQGFYNRITKGSFQSDVKDKRVNVAIRSQYLPSIVKCRTTANGFFGMKIFAHHVTNIFGNADISVLTPLIGCQPKLIHLVRKNLVELTVSFIMAKDTQSWHSEMRSDKSRDTVYNFKAFFDTMIELNGIQNKWRSILKRQTTNDVLTITYKQLSENYTETMERVNEYLGVTDAEIPPPTIKRQVSTAKLKLIEQFTIDCRLNAKKVRTALAKSRHKYR